MSKDNLKSTNENSSESLSSVALMEPFILTMSNDKLHLPEIITRQKGENDDSNDSVLAIQSSIGNNEQSNSNENDISTTIPNNESFDSKPTLKKCENTTSFTSYTCRICQTTNNHTRERLISPCNCKGTLAYVHRSCLERWLNQASRNYCELCLFQFNSVITQRYGFCESLRIWMRHPRNRHNLQADILITCLLTIVTAGLIIICLFGMQYFLLEGYKLGVSVAWTRGTICFFLSIVLLGYSITIYLLIKDQIIPWYHWWRQTLNVRLILTPPSVSLMSEQIN